MEAGGVLFDTCLTQEKGAFFTNPFLYAHPRQKIRCLALAFYPVLLYKLTGTSPGLNEVLSPMQLVLMDAYLDLLMLFTFTQSYTEISTKQYTLWRDA